MLYSPSPENQSEFSTRCVVHLVRLSETGTTVIKLRKIDPLSVELAKNILFRTKKTHDFHFFNRF